MKRKTFTIRSNDVISRLTAFLLEQPKEPLLEVIVQEYKKDRSAVQNSLMWYWFTIISNGWGWSKDEVHDYYKRRFLVRIYERDDIGYALMINSVRKVYSQGFKKDAHAMMKHIVKLTSTTNAKVKQFMEYLKDIERDAASKGIMLPRPEDRYYAATGERQNAKM
jgi:hypothetical protein